MAVQNGDVYQSILSGSLQSSTFKNVFWYELYERGTADTYADSVNGWFINELIPKLRAMMSNQAFITGIQTVNWRSPIDDFDAVVLSAAGTQVIPSMPPFVTATFRSARPAPGYRYSYKRFCGIDEDHVNNGHPQNTGAWEDVKTLLNDLIEFPEGSKMRPVQVKHFKKGVGNLLPPIGTGNPEVAFELTNVWTYKVGSQNSRKY